MSLRKAAHIAAFALKLPLLSMLHPTTRRVWRFSLILLILSTIAVYRPGLNGPFLLDDPHNILPVAVDELTIENIREKIFVGRFAGLSRAATRLTFTLTQHFSGYDPWSFKTQNLMLHCGNGLLLLVFTRQLLTTRAERQPKIAPKWTALTVTAIWLLHPLQVSTVLYAVQRLVLLSAFFSILTLICYVAGRDRLEKKRAHGIPLILVGLLLFWPLGILSKENAVLVAPALLALEWFLFRSHAPIRERRTFIRTITAFLVLTPILMGLILLFTSPYFITSGYSGRDFTMSERLLTQIHALVFYLRLILLPNVSEMGLYHDGFPVQRSVDFATSVAFIFFCALISLGFSLRRTAPVVGFGIIWFFSWHLLESSAIPLELVFEHRNYLALYGLALAITFVPFRFASARGQHRYLAFLFIPLLFSLAIFTHARASIWGTHKSFYEAEYQRDNSSTRAVENMFYYEREWGEPSKAARYLAELQRVAPDESWPLVLEIIHQCSKGRVNPHLKDLALMLAASGRIRPSDVQALRLLWEAIDSGKCSTVDLAFVQHLGEQLVANHRIHTLTTRLGLLKTLTRIAAARGDLVATRRALSQAVNIASSMPQARLQGVLSVAETAASELASTRATQALLKQVAQGHLDLLTSRPLKPSPAEQR